MTDNLKPTCTIGYDGELNLDIEWHGAAGMDDLPKAGTKLYEIPLGYTLIPDEPTIEMISELFYAGDLEAAIGHAGFTSEFIDGYKAMLKAAKESS